MPVVKRELAFKAEHTGAGTRDWWHLVLDTDVPGLYVGSGDILDSEELGEDLVFTLFWQSGSDVPDVAVYGYCMVQTIGGEVLDGVPYDSDVVQPDDLDGLPFWLAPTPDSAGG